jgi:hypothetical protein
MEYSKRGRANPFDAYMNGICLWITPRQILIIEKMCSKFIPEEGIEKDAFLDFKEHIDHEAEIKKKRYFGGDYDEDYTLFDPS